MGLAKYFVFGQSRRSWGRVLLAIWLVVSGLQKFVSIPIPSLEHILAGIAIAAGVLIVLDR